MEKEQKFDLTKGGILQKLLLVSLPIMGTQLMQMTYNLVDMFWLGRVGAGAVAASGTVGMYLWLSNAFATFGRMGAEIGVSQNIGRGDKKTASSYAQTAYSISIILGVLYAAVMIIFRGPLIGFFNIAEAEVVADAKLYLAIVALGVPVTFMTASLTGSFNGSGNTKTPFFINSIGLVVNVILDPVLIFTFNMGIAGAAVATILAQAVVCVVLMIASKKGKDRPFDDFSLQLKVDKEETRQIVRWSLPISIENLLFTGLSMLISRLVAGWGSDAIAVQRVGSQIESLAWLISGGFSSALTAFVGQNYGAGKWTRIRQGYRISAFTMLGWGAIVTGLLFFAAEGLIGIFLPDPVAIRMGAEYLRILAFSEIASCLEFAASGAFRGMGETLPPSITSITVNILRVPTAYFLASVFGLTGVWWALSLGGMMRGIVLFVWYAIRSKTLPREDIAIAE